MHQDSVDRPPTAKEVWVGRILTSTFTLVFGYFAYLTWFAYFTRSAPLLGASIFLSSLCALFFFFFLRSLLSKPRRPSKVLLLFVFSVLAVLGILGLWLAYSTSWPESMPIYGYAIGMLALGVTGVLRHRGKRA
ncbi:MAG: hypothetical protein EOP50_15725 [Sphingobacteriales bacterium]|nr:MAG: hypothetical protein EOP50_15725 [Sphingobacteriales bacterium]